MLIQISILVSLYKLRKTQNMNSTLVGHLGNVFVTGHIQVCTPQVRFKTHALSFHIHFSRIFPWIYWTSSYIVHWTIFQYLGFNLWSWTCSTYWWLHSWLPIFPLILHNFQSMLSMCCVNFCSTVLPIQNICCIGSLFRSPTIYCFPYIYFFYNIHLQHIPL